MRVTRGVRMTALVLCLLTTAGASQPARAQATSAGADAAALQTAPAGVQVPLPGADSVLDRRVKAVAQRLRCPVCQGESIQDSPAELATQMKGLVREQLANGRSEQQVLDYFLAKYGDWILLEPRRSGLNLLLYWVPVVFLLTGGIAVYFVARRWMQAGAPGVEVAPGGVDSPRP
ncbi:MAG: cytochrome c-type biogenesis protein CcmH [Gemmatimonadetes bacterium]|nr:cytochrome c-type biogenesis protein CcmH [Gemmatimonadota bacterium]